MKLILKALLYLFAVIVLCSTSTKIPNILLIGDSISIGYYPWLKKDLSNTANIYHNDGNAQSTTKGVKYVDDWLQGKDYDVILFNWGLWDLAYDLPNNGGRDKINGKIENDIPGYLANLKIIIGQLRKKSNNAKLVFVTTTVVPEGEPGRYSGDVKKCNDAAVQLMQSSGIDVIDLYAFSEGVHRDFKLREHDVHYNEDGYQMLGKFVYEHLMKIVKL